ncbi:unnamed protein product [Haemonchus placei]|uniref:Secreted metalloprotease n=1 Tax=Haemonchus placei TaxID=6290 RepID=A0A0N4X6N0_HAEPC|nr:unnamed protein product [Haemonchus placei]
MLATLILCCLVTVTFGTCSAVFKFNIRPDKVDVGTALPFAIDVLNEESKEFRNSALGLALKRKGLLHGFAVVKNVSNALALIRFDHPELNQGELYPLLIK